MVRIRTANKRRKRKQWHSLRARQLVRLDANTILDFMRAEYIRVGFLYSGSVSNQFLSARLDLSWDAVNTAVDLLLARTHYSHPQVSILQSRAQPIGATRNHRETQSRYRLAKHRRMLLSTRRAIRRDSPRQKGGAGMARKQLET